MDKKQRLKGYCRWVVMAGIFCLFHAVIFAEQLNTITIGLESIGKDMTNVQIASENNLTVGYLNQGNFEITGWLDTNSVKLARDSKQYYFTGNTYHTLEEAKKAAESYGNGAVPAYIEPGTYGIYTLNQQGGLLAAPSSTSRLAFYNDNNELLLVSDNNSTPLLLQGSENGSSFPLTTVAGSRKYRGAVGAVSGQKNGVTPINAVNLEDYLYGVVPIEMAPSWPIEALKAQAVAARSIVYTQYGRYRSKGYDLVDTTSCQVYKGFSAESPNSNRAVDETREEVIKYNNQVAEALYFSTSGGTTEDAKYIWGNEVPYLKAVKDPFETEPAQKPWTRTITLSEISSCLAKAGANIGEPKGVEIASRTPSGRVQTLTILGTTNSYTLQNENVRTFFSASQEGSLKSRLFSFSGFAGTTASNTPEGGMMVSIASANNLVQKKIDGLSVMNSKGMTVLPQKGVVKSADSEKTLTALAGGSINVPQQTEEVLGDLVVYGQGYGHGLGMSQSGAKGMAKAGYNYKDILTYYYSGVTVER